MFEYNKSPKIEYKLNTSLDFKHKKLRILNLCKKKQKLFV